jgi:hypothetical protein
MKEKNSSSSVRRTMRKMVSLPEFNNETLLPKS